MKRITQLIRRILAFLFRKKTEPLAGARHDTAQSGNAWVDDE